MISIEDKLQLRGADSLSDKELLLLLLADMPDAERCVEAVFGRYDLSELADVDLARLRMIDGLGVKRAQRIAVATQIGRRISKISSAELTRIVSNQDVVNYFKPKLASLQYEECWILYLTSSNNVIESYRVSSGGVTATVVDHRMVIKRALELLSTQIIIVHNHPSGAVNPSSEDIELTSKINSAATLFDIRLLDHIIIGGEGSFSFRNNKLLD